MSLPVAFCINLARRPEKWERTQKLWSPYFELKRFTAWDVQGNGALGCKRSHLAAARCGLLYAPVVIVLEDDAVPTKHTDSLLPRCLDHLLAYCGEWDCANMGGFLVAGSHVANLSPTRSDVFLRTDFSLQTHFVAYDKRSFPLLQKALHSNLPLDVYMGMKASDPWVSTRLLATQAPGPSDIGQSPPDQSIYYERSEKLLNEYDQILRPN